MQTAFRQILAAVAVAVVAVSFTACSDSGSESSSKKETTSTSAPAADPDAAAATTLPEVPAEELDPFCEQFNVLESTFSDAGAAQADTAAFVTEMRRLAEVAPEMIADEAALFAEETDAIVQRANDEGVALDDVPDDWFSDEFDAAASSVFQLGYEQCVELPSGPTEDTAAP